MSLFFLAATFPSLSDIVFLAKVAPPLSSLREQQVTEIAPKVSISFMQRYSAAVVKQVTFWDWSNPNKSTYIEAELGMFFTEDWGDFVLLQRGKLRSSIAGRDDEAEEPVAFERMALPLRPKIDLKLRGRGYYEEPLNLLLNPPAKAGNDPLEWRRWIAEGHHRIIIATLCLNYVLLAVGVMISARFQRVGILWRSVSLAVAIFALYGLLILAHVGVIYGVVPLWLLYLFAVVPAATGGYLLLRQSRSSYLAPYCRQVMRAGHALSSSERAGDLVGTYRCAGTLMRDIGGFNRLPGTRFGQTSSGQIGSQ
jgi:lipopolysaccharide export LptBFGC system permease protein LptF